MEALRRMATGTPEEQADVRLQIEEENAAMEKDMKEASTKIFGKKVRNFLTYFGRYYFLPFERTFDTYLLFFNIVYFPLNRVNHHQQRLNN